MKKIGIHPLFLAVGALLAILGQGILFLNYFLAVCLHEWAHAFVAQKLGYKLNKFFLMPYGAGLSFKQNFFSEKDEIIIASAGPSASFGFAILCIAIWWIWPETYPFTEIFMLANLSTGIINLLPAYPLDGGRVLTAFLTHKKQNRKNALKICFIFNYIISALFLILFAFNIQGITLLIFAIFIFLGTFENKFSGTYNLCGFDFLSPFTPSTTTLKINQFAISAEQEIFKIARTLKPNQINLVYIVFNDQSIKLLTQKQLQKLFESYPSSFKIKDCL